MDDQIKLLFATQTGTAEEVAEEVRDELAEGGISVELCDLCMTEDLGVLRGARWILGVVSTWGDGEPPDDAVPFFENLRVASSLELSETRIAILGLGDSGYDIFCGCGKELERELIRHGAQVGLDRVDCDVWYEEELAGWIVTLRAMLAESVSL